MVLTIKNFESQNVGPGVVETAPTNLVGVAGTLKATLTWTSATGESGVTWTEEKLVRKEGSAPQGSADGTTVATITTKDTYSSTGYEDTGLDSTKTYYYKVFAVYDNGTERGSTDVNVTPNPWEPGANTIAYYPLTSETTVNDMSGNNRNLTNNGGTFGTYEGVSCAYLGGNNRYLYINNSGMPTGNSARTFAFWHYNLNSTPTRNPEPFISQGTLGRNQILILYTGDSGQSSTNSYYNQISQYGEGSEFGISLRQEWVCNVVTYDGAKFTRYVNGAAVASWTRTIDTRGGTLSIGASSQWLSTWNAFNGYMSKVVLASGVRTQREISDYYNSTKYDYGL